MAHSGAAELQSGLFLTMLEVMRLQGVHGKGMMASVLTGRAGNWITVGGTQSERSVNCFGCAMSIMQCTRTMLSCSVLASSPT